MGLALAMSQYLIEQMAQRRNISVKAHAKVVSMEKTLWSRSVLQRTASFRVSVPLKRHPKRRDRPIPSCEFDYGL
jgi:hypothetical protein